MNERALVSGSKFVDDLGSPTSHSSTSPPQRVARPDQNVSETIDIARGLAAVAMIVNHAGVALLDPGESTAGPFAALLFAGGFAPAIFFFLTGYGSGLQPPGKAEWMSLARKVALLCLADQLLIRFTGRTGGLDFFGFIAISTLVVHCIRVSIAPAAISISLI